MLKLKVVMFFIGLNNYDAIIGHTLSRYFQSCVFSSSETFHDVCSSAVSSAMARRKALRCASFLTLAF